MGDEDDMGLLSQLAESDIESEDIAETNDSHDVNNVDTMNGNTLIDNRKKGSKAPKFQRLSGKKYDEEFFRPPTAEEITRLRETQALFHSNLFRLQIQELFEELTVKKKYEIRFRNWLSQFSNFVTGLAKSKSYSLDNYDWLDTAQLFVPLPSINSLPKLKGTFTFMPPKEVQVVGSYALDLVDRHSIDIDIAVILPEEFYRNNELYDGRYIISRAIFLAFLSKHLKEFSLIKHIEFTQHHSNPLRPILKINPDIQSSAPFNLFLYPVPPCKFFRNNLLDPRRENLRPNKMFKYESSLDSKECSSPFYNFSCGIDAFMIEHHIFAKEQLSSQNIRGGLKLFRLWWKRRMFHQGCGGMSFHVVIMFTIFLLKQRKITEQMSSYQVYRTLLLSFIEYNWSDGNISLALKTECTNVGRKRKREGDICDDVEEISYLYPLTFTGSDGFLNLVGSVSLSTLEEIRHECHLAIDILETSSSDSFDSLYMNNVSFDLKFDHLIKIQYPTIDYDSVLELSTDKSKLERLDSLNQGSYNIIWEKVVTLLEKGLGDRVKLISIKKDPAPTWSVGEHLTQKCVKTTIGFILSDTACALLTKGPPADAPDSNDFRKFWGDLSSLRRFKDGSFHEAVMWGEATSAKGSKRNIPIKIARYILSKYFNFRKKNVHDVSNQIEEAIHYNPRIDLGYDYGTGEECIQSCAVAFNSLCSVLRNVEMPLKISTIISVSDVIRHGYVFPPVQIAVPRGIKDMIVSHATLPEDMSSCIPYKHAIEALLFLEVSGKWPEDLSAISAIKVEFLCSLAVELRKKKYVCNVFPEFIQVLSDGYIFRLKVCHRREIYLRRLVPVESNGKTTNESFEELKEKDTESSLSLEKEIEVMPRLNAALSNLNNEYSSYSASVRLALRWVSSQLLLCQINPIAVELLMAYIFTQPGPFRAPNSAHAAMLRFWNLVTDTDWNCTPLLINIGGQFSTEDEAEILKQFTSNRDAFPRFFICTPCELRGDMSLKYDTRRRFRLLSTWTKTSPNAIILSRLKAVCHSALTYYRAEIKKKYPSIEPLFIPPLTDYDILIHLNPAVIARRMERVTFTNRKEVNGIEKVKIKAYEKKSGEMMPVVDFDPVSRYFDDLQSTYSQHCMFFYDNFGGEIIGVVWKPTSQVERDAKPGSIDGHHLLMSNETKMIANIDAFIEDFKIIGKGLVKNVEINKH